MSNNNPTNKADGGAIFIGSLPYDTATAAFKEVTSVLGNHLHSISDGETGERWNFVDWQTAKWPKHLLHDFMGGDPDPNPVSPAEAEKLLGNHQTDYDTAAIASYEVFRKLRDAGEIPKHLKFQVCVPTAMNCVGPLAYVHRPALEPFIEASLKRALRNIQDAIPHEDLSLQIDCSAEFCILENACTEQYIIFQPWFDDAQNGVHERIIRSIKGVIDDDVRFGMHLCYGDYLHKHFTEPNTNTLASVCTTILEKSGCKVDYLHIPVPKDLAGKGEQYFEPLREILGLLEKSGTMLYLGLVHPNDAKGTEERIGMAKKVLGPHVKFGIASECGLGREPREHMGDLLAQMRDLSATVT
jgi:hypothetical protein